MGWKKWLQGLRTASAKQATPTPLGDEIPAIPFYEQLLEKLDYEFQDVSLIRTALTHRSHVYRAGKERLQSNERLEFLGDSVLGLIVNEHLFRVFPQQSEGELTKTKSLIVSRAVLGRAAEVLGLGEHLILAPGEVDAGGRNRRSILSDAYEAVLGAIYLDGGMRPSRRFVENDLLVNLEETVQDDRWINYKSVLQERIQARLKTPPRYKVSSTSGPDHAKQFMVEVIVRGKTLGRGRGNSKKIAEQRAAQEALDSIDEDSDLLSEGS